MMMRLRTDDEELMQIAVLHDTVEDTEVTIESLREQGFSERVLAGVEALTKRPGEGYMDFIIRCSGNKDAILVKLEDLRDNSDITRLKGVTRKDFERVEKYNKAFVYLKNCLSAQIVLA